MNRGMFDMMMQRRMMGDGRNPYGSRGGYVTSRKDRAYGASPYSDGVRGVRGSGRYGRDRATSYYDGEVNYDIEGEDYRRGRRYDGAISPEAGYRENPTLYRNIGREEEKFERSGKGEWSPYPEDGHYYPFEIYGGVGRYPEPYEDMMYDYARRRNSRGQFMRDRMYDYPMYDGAEEGMLTDKELEHWAKKLLEEVDEKDKPFFRFESIKKKAEDMGIKFDKFSPMEFYVTALMMATDYSKTIGTANMDVYLRLAKDFLEDKDSELKGGEKLAAYYDVVCPE